MRGAPRNLEARLDLARRPETETSETKEARRPEALPWGGALQGAPNKNQSKTKEARRPEHSLGGALRGAPRNLEARRQEGTRDSQAR